MKKHAYDYWIDPKAIGSNIRVLRLSRGFDVRDMVEYFGCAFQTVYRWESGVSVPSLDNLFAMAKLFEVSLDRLIIGGMIDRTAA